MHCGSAPARASSPTRIPSQELAETRAKAEGLLRALNGAAAVSTWINGRARTAIDCRDRGLQYGDGLFETMRDAPRPRATAGVSPGAAVRGLPPAAHRRAGAAHAAA